MSENLQGWVNDQKLVEEIQAELANPFFYQAAPLLKGSGRGKISLLHKHFETLGIKFPLRKQTIGDCKKKGTLVIGPDNVKKIEDIKVGDRVYAGNGEITTVISTTCKKSYNPILKIHTKGGLPLEVTSDHKILVYQFEKFANPKCKRRYSKGLQESVINTNGLNSQNKYKVIYDARQAKLVKASELKETDYILCPTDIRFDSNIPKDIISFFQSKELSWMIGLFLGDGCVPKTKKLQITWGCTSDYPEIEKRLCQALDSINLKWSSCYHCKGRSDKARIVRVSNKRIANLLYKYFYDENGYKVLPSWAINDDVIAGLLDADGYKDNKRQYFENTSPSLTHGLRLWALTKGYVPCLNKRQRFDKRTNKLNKISYSVSWNHDKKSRNLWRDDKYIAMPITKIEVEEGPHEEVYDIGVLHHLHTFIDGCGGVISNCVSMGSALAVDTLKVAEIVNGDREEWVAETSTEDIYWGSRIIVGKGRLGNGDGSIGAWAVKYMHTAIGGTLVRKLYEFDDLTVYSGQKARTWGSGRAPNGIIEEAKKHPIQTYTAVKSYEDVIDSLYNQYPVIICSNQGFSSTRDSEGFCSPKGSWAHCMMLIASDDAYKRPGCLCVNSWGNYLSGPKRHGQPDGSFWIDASVIERIVRQNDSWAISDFNGFVPRPNARII